MLDEISVVKLLTILLSNPYACSFIERHYIDEVEDLGLFDLDEGVTSRGRDYLAQYDCHNRHIDKSA